MIKPTAVSDPTSGQGMTQAILALSTLGILAYDYYALKHWGYQSTVSYLMLSAAQKQPILAFMVGGLMGHLFAPQSGANSDQGLV